MRNTSYMGKLAPMDIGHELNLQVTNPSDGITVQIEDYHNNGDIIAIPIDEEVDFRAFHYYGTVTDSDDGNGIPSATIKIYRDSVLLGSGAADKDGNFGFYTDQEADSVQITSIGYKGKLYPLTLIRHDFPLEKDLRDLDPVTVTSTKKTSWIILLALAAVVAHEEKLI